MKVSKNPDNLIIELLVDVSDPSNTIDVVLGDLDVEVDKIERLRLGKYEKATITFKPVKPVIKIGGS